MEMWDKAVEFIANSWSEFAQRLDLESGPLLFLDIFIVLSMAYIVYRLIQGTRAVRILIGLLIIEAFILVARFSDLQILNWVLSRLFTVFLIAIPVLFQPELRRALSKLGERGLPRTFLNNRVQSFESVNELVQGVSQLVHQRLGGLIVLKGITGLDEFIETGTRVDARISAKLIESIFHKNSPLHDGALILDADRILAAGCLYTHAIPDRASGQRYGLRHRAAIGFSLESDAVAIVVSEERAVISFVNDGKIEQVSLEELERRLLEPLTFVRPGLRSMLETMSPKDETLKPTSLPDSAVPKPHKGKSVRASKRKPAGSAKR